MALDPDAADYLSKLDIAMPQPLHVLGVEAGRTLRMDTDAAAAPSLWRVEDVFVGEVVGDRRAGPADEPHARSNRLRARVYRPSETTEAPVLVYLHGGGWSIGSLDGVDSLCRTLAHESDVVVVSVDYRQAPEHPYPAAVQDAWRTLRWVYEGNLPGVRTDRVAIGGDSAGGNLAAVCATLAAETGLIDLKAQLLVYPPTDAADESSSTREFAEAPVLTTKDVDWFWNLYLPAGSDRTAATISPKNARNLSDLPPTAVFTAQYDPIRDDAEDFADRLRRAGVTVEQRRYEGVYHGFFPLVGLLAGADRAVRDAATWLQAQLSDDARVLA